MTTLQETVLECLPKEFLTRLGELMTRRRSGSITLHVQDGKIRQLECKETSPLT